MSSLKIYINGVDMSQFLQAKSLKINMDSSHFKTCSLTLVDITIAGGVPEEGKILTVDFIKDDSTTIHIFSGVIDEKNIKQLHPATDRLSVDVTSNGFRYVPYRRTVTDMLDIPDGQEYISANYIVDFFVNAYLKSEGISYANMTEFEGKRYTDPTQTSYVCMTIGDILDQLASDSYGNWYIDIYRNLYFVQDYATQRGASSADIDVDTGISVDFRNQVVKTALQDYANKVFFKGDLQDVDLTEVTVFAQDDNEIAHMSALDGGSGVYGMSVENANVLTQDDAQAYCQKILDKKKSKPKSLQFDTFDWMDFSVGDTQDVNIPLFGITNTPDKPANYVVESISLTDMGAGKLTKQVEMRQLFPTGSGSYTWTKSNAGVQFFQSLVQAQKQASTNTKNMLKNHSYVENLRGGVLSTQNLTGDGDYIQLERQFMTFWDASAQTAPKMTMGFVADAYGNNIPGIVFGAGDGSGNNRGYITKDENGLGMYYVNSNGVVSVVLLQDDGTLQLNGYQIAALDQNGQLASEYIQQSGFWNKALSGFSYDGTDGYGGTDGNYTVPTIKLDTPTQVNIGQGQTAYGNLTNPDYGFVDATGAILKAKIAAASEWDSKVDGTYPKFTNITNTGVYTGTLSAGQITSGTIATERIAVLPDANIASAADWVKNSDGKFTYISPTGVYTGTLTANQVNAVSVNASKLAMLGNPNNYGSIGGAYGDLVLYYDNSEYFRIYNDLGGGMSFQQAGVAFLDSAAGNTTASGAWDFSNANVGGIGVTSYGTNSSGTRYASVTGSYNDDYCFCNSIGFWSSGTSWQRNLYFEGLDESSSTIKSIQYSHGSNGSGQNFWGVWQDGAEFLKLWVWNDGTNYYLGVCTPTPNGFKQVGAIQLWSVSYVNNYVQAQ